MPDMNDRIRVVLLQLLMQPKWDSKTGRFGFTDDIAASDALRQELIEPWHDDEGLGQYRLTEKGKRFLDETP